MNFGLSDLKELKPRNDKMDNLSYLVDNYLSESARFPHHQWNYHMALSEHDFTITTNSLENLNGKLKAKVGTGFLSRPKAYKKLKEFHSDYICLYTAKVVHNRMPKIKPKYLKREQNLLEKLEEFHSLSFEYQVNILEF